MPRRACRNFLDVFDGIQAAEPRQGWPAYRKGPATAPSFFLFFGGAGSGAASLPIHHVRSQLTCIC